MHWQGCRVAGCAKVSSDSRKLKRIAPSRPKLIGAGLSNVDPYEPVLDFFSVRRVSGRACAGDRKDSRACRPGVPDVFIDREAVMGLRSGDWESRGFGVRDGESKSGACAALAAVTAVKSRASLP